MTYATECRRIWRAGPLRGWICRYMDDRTVTNYDSRRYVVYDSHGQQITSARSAYAAWDHAIYASQITARKDK
jgi:hypothetical protein